MTHLPDARDREQAARDFSTNLVVIAGAGTGKTSLLVERYLNLVLTDSVPMERVAAITFTEKAAAEMRARIGDALESVVLATRDEEPVAPPEHGEAERTLEYLINVRGESAAAVHGRTAAALTRLDRAAISTIHSFCFDLLHRHPVEAALPPDFTVAPAPELDRVFDRLWPGFLMRELGNAPTRDALWAAVIPAFGEAEIETLARSLARNPSAMDALAEGEIEPWDAKDIFAETAVRLVADLRDHLNDIEVERREKKRLAVQDHLESAVVLLECFLKSGPSELRAYPAETLPRPAYWEDNAPRPKSLDAAWRERIHTSTRDAQRLLKALRRISEEAVTELLAALQPFAREFQEEIHQKGTLTYDHLLLFARNLLRDRPGIRRREAGRIGALLVDEFQDTDPLQYEIVFYLCSQETDASDAQASARETNPQLGIFDKPANAAAATENDPYRLPLAPGGLFIVGDPKQSIYRFRGADMGAYRRAVDHVTACGGREARLQTNFRSLPGILDPVNRLFGEWMNEDDRDPSVEPEYIPLHASRKTTGDDPRIHLWSLVTQKKDTIEQRRIQEAREIVREIERMVDSKSDGPIDYRDIALLFRAMTDITLYVRAFREAGIPFVVDGGNAFAERPEVVEGLALLRALANPADAVATLAVLRSTLGGVRDAELAAYAAAKGRFSWVHPEPALEETYPGVGRGLSLLRRLHAEGENIPVDRNIIRLLTEGNFPLAMAGYAEGAQRVANLRLLADRAAELSRERRLTLDETIQILDAEFLSEDDLSERPLADESLNAVRLLSMHRAKGLEYPVVILPDIGRKQPNPEYDTEARLLRASPGNRVAVRVRKLFNTAMAMAVLEDARHEIAETKRLLYVAMTRAKNRLILVNHHHRDLSRWVKALNSWGYEVQKGSEAAACFPEDGVSAEGVEHRRIHPGGPLTRKKRVEQKDVANYYAAFTQARDRVSEPPPGRHRTPSGDHRGLRSISASEEDRAAAGRTRDLALALGQAMHEVLETGLGLEEPGGSSEFLAAAAARAAAASGFPQKTIQDELEIMINAVNDSELGERLRGADILGKEMPILYRDDAGTTVTGYADLVYRWEGRVHVADYKTDRETGPERVEAYRSQLEDYAAAVERGLGLNTPPVSEVWFLRTGRRVPLTHDEEVSL